MGNGRAGLGIVEGTIITLLTFFIGTSVTIIIEPRLNFLKNEPGPSAKFSSENIKPVHSDTWMYNSAPIVALTGLLLAAVIIPVNKNLVGADMGIGIFYFIVVVDYVVLAVALGGWGGNLPESIESCYRIVAQLVSYVVPLGLAIIGPIMMAKSMSTQEIIKMQSGLWFIVLQPLGFVLYVVTGLMQVYRAPFLEPFAKDINKGIISAYGGWKGKIWRFGLSGVFFVVAAMGAILFLGGWNGPVLPGFLWMMIKTLALLIFMKWIGQKIRLLSTAKMLELAWKILIPAGLLNVLIVGGLILLGVNGA
jgi:NADH-quinone oxidoreductase subunit H